ncbi:MAG: hypothetical protein ACKOC1_09425, partial [Hyphomicrobiales bacterium]
MADYYPLISRSIEALVSSTPESRQRIYDHAKHALVVQLRLLNPPISEVGIMRERLALESAIRKFERTCIATRTDLTQNLIERQQVEGLDKSQAPIFSENFQTGAVEPVRDEGDFPVSVLDDPDLYAQELKGGDIQTVEDPQFINIIPRQKEKKIEEINLYVSSLNNKQIFSRIIFKNRYFYRVTFIIIVLSTLSFSILQTAQFLQANRSNIDAKSAS